MAIKLTKEGNGNVALKAPYLNVDTGKFYDAGYTDGERAGYDKGYGEGYTEGEKVSYDIGYNKGFEDGSANTEADIVDGLITGELSGDYYNDRITKTRSYACAYNKITSADFPNVVELGFSCFISCKNLTSINFPKLDDINDNVFYGTDLRDVLLPKARIIGGYTFYNCANLTRVELPCADNFTGAYIVYGCTSLKAFIVGRDNKNVCRLSRSNAFDNTEISKGNAFIYVPDNLVEQYKVASNWAKYASQIKGISELAEG